MRASSEFWRAFLGVLFVVRSILFLRISWNTRHYTRCSSALPCATSLALWAALVIHIVPLLSCFLLKGGPRPTLVYMWAGPDSNLMLIVLSGNLCKCLVDLTYMKVWHGPGIRVGLCSEWVRSKAQDHSMLVQHLLRAGPAWPSSRAQIMNKVCGLGSTRCIAHSCLYLLFLVVG